MRALIIIPQYLPYGGAVANIVSNIVKNKAKVSFDILTSRDSSNIDYSFDGYKVLTFDNKQMYTSKKLLKNLLTKGNAAELKKRILKKIGIKKTNWIDYSLVSEISDSIIKLANEGEKYDVYIPVVANPSMYLGVKQAFSTIGRIGKMVVYQVDPIAGNFWHDSIQSNEWLTFESRMYEYADKVIIHPVQNNTSPIDKNLLISKAVSIEWPLLFDKTVEPVYDKEIITCFFSGYLDDTIRSPKYFIELIEKIENPYVKFVFYSPGKRELIYKYATEKAASKIEYHDAVPFEECMEAMRKASVLINIGNNCINQMPSKLFDYISTGKPIINICKHTECPTLAYLNRYPAALNIIEGKGNIVENARLINEFIIRNSSKYIPYSTLKSLYALCESKPVVNKIEDVLLTVCK